MKLVYFLFFVFIHSQQSQAQSENFQIPSRSTMAEEFRSRTVPLNNWLNTLNEEGFDLICFGETHNSYFRELESTKIIPLLNINNLLVETQNSRVETILLDFNNENFDNVNVTGATFTNVLEELFRSNPLVSIIGIEPSNDQTNQATLLEIEHIQNGTITEYTTSRDSMIAENIKTILESGKTRNLAIYGANHCNYFGGRLGFDTPFMRFLTNYYQSTKKIINVHTFLPEQDNLLRIYMEGFGLIERNQDTILFNTKSIPPENYNYNLELLNLLQAYDVIFFPAN